MLRQIAVDTGQNEEYPLDEIWSDDIQKAFGGSVHDDHNAKQGNESLSQGEIPKDLWHDFSLGSDSTLPLLNGDELK